MANELTIPILPCRSINDMLIFYRAMGFEVTYQQEKPNTYACVQRGDINLHFFTLKDYDPAQSYSTCFILVPDANGLRQSFVAGLRGHYGRLPAAGIPRLTPLRKMQDGGMGFNVIDPGGNWIRIGQRNATAEDEPVQRKAATKLARAVQAAELLADSKGDYAAAAKMLDAALAQDGFTPAERIPALVLRAGIAITMGEPEYAEGLLQAVRHTSLNAEERDALSDDLERAEDLEQQMGEM